MAKEFIRHLEFYGFPDTNGYASSTNANVDLSNIIKKNEEQDQAIANLGEQEWVSEEELHHLNEKVNTFIETQNEINNNIDENLGTIKDDVNNLKNNSNLFAEELSGVTIAVNELLGDTESLNNKIEALSSETISANQELHTYVDENFANKNTIYTKEEVDEKVVDMATKTWVGEQGFLTQDVVDNRYATKDALDELNQDVQGISGNLDTINNEINTLSDKLDGVDVRFDEVNSKIDTTNSEISSLEQDVQSLSGSIDERLDAIESWKVDAEDKLETHDVEIIELNETKANVNDLNTLSNTLTSEFNTYKTEVNGEVQHLAYIVSTLNQSKADSSAITIVEQAISNETNERQTKDTALSGAISTNAANIRVNTSDISSIRTNLNTLENSIATERNERISADSAIIGTNDGDVTKNTIWGVKALANNNLRVAKEYSDTKSSEVLASSKSYTVQYFTDNIERELNGKADLEDVIELNNQTKRDASEQITSAVTPLYTAISNESVRAQGKENAIDGRVDGLVGQISTLSTRLGAITEWQGTDPTEYSDSGNGVLDAMHRELHTLNIQFASLIQQLRDNYNINIQL